jgi:hypothetical protein
VWVHAWIVSDDCMPWQWGSLRNGVGIAVKAWPPKVGKTVWILDKQQYAEGTLSQLRNGKARALPEHRGGSRGKDPAVRVQSGSPCAVQHPRKIHDGAINGRPQWRT